MRLQIANGRGRLVKAAGEIGPYLKINKRVYHIGSTQYPTKGRPGSWFRASPVAKDGSLGKEKEFTLSEDGKSLTFYKNHSHPKMPVSFENIGDKLPVKKAKKPSPAKFKKVMVEPGVKKALSLALKLVEKDKEKAKAVAIGVLEDVNASSGAVAVEKALGKGDTSFKFSAGKLGQILDYDVIAAAAFGAALLKAVGDGASATKLLKVYIDAYPDLWKALAEL